jgi:hypothetical protein
VVNAALKAKFGSFQAAFQAKTQAALPPVSWQLGKIKWGLQNWLFKA